MCQDCVYNTPVLLRRLMLKAGFREEDLDFAALEEVMSGEKKTPCGMDYDVDLGDGHYLFWTETDGELTGGLIIHSVSPPAGAYPAVRGECHGAFTLRFTKAAAENPEERATGEDGETPGGHQ